MSVILRRRAEELRRLWSGSAVCGQEWQALTRESCSRWPQANLEVEDASGRIAICKPAVRDVFGAKIYQGANEFIAFRLAEIVDVSVAPVTLYRCFEQNWVLSAFAFPEAVEWSNRRFFGPAANGLEDPLGQQFARALVFHCWIGDADHGLNSGRNAILDGSSLAAPDGPGIAFIDHGLAFGWREWDCCQRCYEANADYMVPKARLPNEGIDTAVQCIADVGDAQIWDIINQIPPDFLPTGRAEPILKGLRERRNALRSLVNW